MGYAFINLLSPMLVQQFFEAYNGKRWCKGSDKVCQLRYANQQGRRDIINQLGLAGQ